ncbi:hypothetical protein [Nocardia aurantiaca]|uniref:Uncharacterized protein n=1 Tax=Nocardia aurantiaca TaxID=2675850 RepID=A0A6I3L7I1_9NOCA|nr:hypothetical protein [Nocardia aurantiaca]MTE16940.1 hypothetical protein [Nocardia aurantiaca]
MDAFAEQITAPLTVITSQTELMNPRQLNRRSHQSLPPSTRRRRREKAALAREFGISRETVYSYLNAGRALAADKVRCPTSPSRLLRRFHPW